MKQRKENVQALANKKAGVSINTASKGAGKPPAGTGFPEKDDKVFGKVAIGPTYNMLKPEVK